MGDRRSFGGRLADLAAEAPDAPAVTCAGRTITRRALERSANHLARRYAALGVAPGDVAVLRLPNALEFFVAAFAAWKVGAVPLPVAASLPAPEQKEIIDLARPAVVVGTGGDSGSAPVIPRKEVPVDHSGDESVPDVVSPSWKAATSGGSTGRPKLIVSSRPADFAAGDVARYRMRPEDRQLVCGPLHHSGPFSYSVLGLCLGQSVVVLERFDPVAVLTAIQDESVTWMMVVPTMMSRMLRARAEVPDADLSSLRMVLHMGGPCADWLKRAWIDWVGPEVVTEVYSGTEGIAVAMIDGAEWLRHPGSVGRAVFGEMVVLAPDGSEAPRGEVGEIYMRPPPGVVSPYRYVGSDRRAIGDWESLGDLGWMDDDGYLYISDRRTDMIVVGGANVFPAEVEAALESHPAVVDAVVVGLPDEDLGARLHAVVHTRAPVDPQTLIDHVRQRLVGYKTPKSVEFVPAPLRDDAGKVRRSLVRDRARTSEADDLRPSVP